MTTTFYDEIGGLDTIRGIVTRFYAGVAADEVLRPMYPEEDLGPAAERFTLFLAQYWGGPTTYSDERGHPKLRMRHFPYLVGPLQRDRWLLHMRAAVETVCDDPSIDAEVGPELMTYFVTAAEHLRNDTGLPITSATYGTDRERS